MNKEQSIRWMNALNNASLLVSWNLRLEVLTESELKSRVEDLANWFYELFPKEINEENKTIEEEIEAIFPYKELEKKIESANTKEELEKLLEEVKGVAKESQSKVFWLYNDKKIKFKK